MNNYNNNRNFLLGVTVSTVLPLLLIYYYNLTITNNRTNEKKCFINSKNKISLIDYAINKKMFLDESRKLFLQNQENIIKELSEGSLSGRNRFRVLLLGVKAVGKTEICKLIQSYLREIHTNIFAVYISYDTSTKLISEEICHQLHSQKGVEKKVLRHILSSEDISDRIEKLEGLLEQKELRIVLIVDEFQFVYNKAPDMGVPIVREMSAISGSTRGNIHCIVTGSSSRLRSLAFVKLPVEEEGNYPSYMAKIDLNSTKLQPKWIFPIYKANDFKELLHIRNICAQNIALRYFCSGGRPGLALEEANLNDICYSLTAKHLLNDVSQHAAVLRGLFDCMDSLSVMNTGDDEGQADTITIYESVLTPVQDDILWNRLTERMNNERMDNERMDRKVYEQTLYCLADDGMIIFYQSGQARMITISCSYIYYQLQGSRGTSLTWKEAAALKMPTGYFHEIAEEVAFRFIKAKSSLLFKIDLRRQDSTYFCLGKTNGIDHKTYFSIDSELKLITKCIHKEIYDGNDKCGADGILLVNKSEDDESQGLRLLRFQLKLGNGKFTDEQIKELKGDMFRRGKSIVAALSKKYKINEHSCYLITTKHTEKCSGEMDKSDQTFSVIGPELLADVWSGQVKRLGRPYAANKKLDYELRL